MAILSALTLSSQLSCGRGRDGSSFLMWWSWASSVPPLRAWELNHPVILHANAGLILSISLDGHMQSSLQPKEP